MAKPNKFILAPNGVVYQQIEGGVRQALCYAQGEGGGRIVNLPSGSTVVKKDGFALASMEQVKAVHAASPNPPPAEFLVEEKDGSLSPYVFPEPPPAPAPATAPEA